MMKTMATGSPLDLTTKKSPLTIEEILKPTHPVVSPLMLEHIPNMAQHSLPTPPTESGYGFLTPPNDRTSPLRIPTIDMPLCSPESQMLPQRPFKAFTQQKFFEISAFDLETNPEYVAFRQSLLTKQSRTNSNMRRNVSSASSKDPEYLEKRRRNNLAAKKSRDMRRMKEDELAIRCAFLERENQKLKFKVQLLERQLSPHFHPYNM